MAWVKVTDGFFRDPKIIRCDVEAKLLFIAGLTYCADQLTDGAIPKEALALLSGMAGIANAQASAERLLEVGLWVASPDGSYFVPRYLKYNPSREQALKTKSARKEAGSKGGKASRAIVEALAQADARASAQANARAKSKQNSTPSPSPYPSMDSPPLTPPQGGVVSRANGEARKSAVDRNPRKPRTTGSGSRTTELSEGGNNCGQFSKFSSIAK